MIDAAFRPLCFDLATNTGWAFHDGAQPSCGLWDLTAPFGNNLPGKLDSFSRRLKQACDHRKPTLIAAESPLIPGQYTDKDGKPVRFNVDSLIQSYSLYGHLQLVCRRLEIPFRPVNTTEIKKIATGHGSRWKDPVTREWRHPNKVLVLECMKLRYPDLTIETHDVADALGILTLLIAEHKGTGAPVQSGIKVPAMAKKVRGRRSGGSWSAALGAARGA